MGDEWDELGTVPFTRLMAAHRHEAVAMILESIVQGAGGVCTYRPEQLKRICKIYDREEILLIINEIATGFSRTDKFLACEYVDITPGILYLGRALTDGTMAPSATFTTHQIAETTSNGEAGCFMHGPTFMGNPLTCIVASASLSLIETGKWCAQVTVVEAQLWAELAPAVDSCWAADVRMLGAIDATETAHPVNMVALQKFSIEQGVRIRPFDKLIYLISPYIIQPNQPHRLAQTMNEAVRNATFFSD